MEGIARDVTDRIILEERLQQSQKMEAVGRLAGGIAHDFNNLLTAITGYSELLLSRADDLGPLRKYIDEILRAGRSSESLTRQLLAFSRGQVLQPKVLDLNTVVGNIHKMLRRLMARTSIQDSFRVGVGTRAIRAVAASDCQPGRERS